MGTWGTAISSNDTYADVYGEFFEQYNDGLEVIEITNKLIGSHQGIIDDPDESNNFWFALAKAQWECKRLDPSVYSKVKNIIESKSDITVWHQLGAEEKEINKRKIALDKFLEELSKERVKIKARKRKIIRQPAFSKGDCIIFKLNNGNYGGAVILEAISNSPYPYNLVATTALNQSKKPTTKDFTNSNVLIINFGKNDDKPSINWILPIRYKNVAHLFEKIDTINVKLIYDIKKIGYGFCGDFDIWIIEQANRQFEHELSGNKKSNKSISIESLINSSKWKLW